MADAPDGPKSSRTLLLVAVAVVILALLAWQFGLFGRAGVEEATEPTYEAGVTDIGGGDLIVTEPDPDAVQVELPETPMTPVPPTETPAE
jgi:hypothetical protein